MTTLPEIIVGLATDLQQLKTAFGNSLRVGPVEQIDAQKGYRINEGVGSDGQPKLSPWYPHPESGGQTSSSFPLSKGQIVGILHPNGNPRQGVLIRGGYSGENGPPSEDMQANVLKAFGITITMKDGTTTLEGDLHVKGNVDFEGGHVRHNERNIGDDHRHIDVMPGGGLSGPPEG